MVAGVIRPRKDGGCSLCRAKEVGKRRCCHVLGGVEMVVRHERGMNFVDINGDMSGEKVAFSIPATQNKIVDYMTAMSDALPEKQKNAIFKTLHIGL